MFKICEHGQPVGTNCIDCIIDKSPEPKVRVKYHIHDPFGEQEEMAGYLDSPSDVKEKRPRAENPVGVSFQTNIDAKMRKIP